MRIEYDMTVLNAVPPYYFSKSIKLCLRRVQCNLVTNCSLVVVIANT